MNNTEPIKNQETYNLDKFPKELKKKIYQGLEPRFTIVLLSSLFLHMALALFLSTHLSKKNKSNSVEKARKQFAWLLLDKNPEYVEYVKELESTPADYASPFDLLESFSSELKDYNPPIDELLNLPGELTSSREGPSSKAIRAQKELIAERRRSAREELYEEVERIGLLGVITSGSGVVTYTEIVDILQFADSTAADLEQKLAFLTSLRAPRGEEVRMKTTRGLPVLLTKPSVEQEPPTIKGTRSYSDKVQVDDLVENLGDVKEITIKRTEEYEDVPSSYSLTSLRSASSNGTTTRMNRDPDEVRDIVMSHYSAIQDCYTQALKSNPALKGKVVVRFIVSPEGRVISASVVKSTIYDNQMIDCMLARILRWNDFPPVNPAAGNMAFKQTYVFGL
jgi:TonB family protein